MPKIHKMISLDPETYEIAQRMTNFSGHVRKILKEQLIDVDDLTPTRCLSIALNKVQKELGYDSEEALAIFKMFEEVKSWGV